MESEKYRRQELEHLYKGLKWDEAFIVLDALCGSGFASSPIRNKVRKVIGVDIKEKSASLTLDYIQKPLEEVDFPRESFDLVIAHKGFHHVGKGSKEKQLDALRAVYRILKKNRVFAISDLEGNTSASDFNDTYILNHGSECRWLTLKNIKEMLNFVGFRDIEAKLITVPWEFNTYSELEGTVRELFHADISLDKLANYQLLNPNKPIIEFPFFFARGVK